MRPAYQEHAGELVRVLRDHARDHISIDDPQAGMHLVVRLTRASADTVCETLWRAGIEALSFSFYMMQARVAPALVLGFAGAKPREIEIVGKEAAEIIAACSR